MALQVLSMSKLIVAIPKSVRAAIWTVIVLLIAESGLRLRAWHRHGGGSPVADIYQLDAEGRRELKAGAAMTGSQRSVRINQHGFRGAEIELPKPPDVTRIVALGDSTTFGMEAGDDDAIWVSRLVAELAGRSGSRFDSINAAIPGNRLEDSFRLLKERIAPLQPDIVIVSQVATDIAAHARRQHGSAASVTHSATPLSALLQESSLLVNLVRVNAAAITSRWLPGGRYDSLDPASVDRYRDQLREIVAHCRTRNWQVVLCTAPRSFGDRPDQYALAASSLANNPALSLRGLNAAFDAYNDAIRRVARETNTPLIDLDRDIPRGAEYFVDAIHFSDAGHRLVGRIAASALQPLIEMQAVARSAP